MAIATSELRTRTVAESESFPLTVSAWSAAARVARLVSAMPVALGSAFATSTRMAVPPLASVPTLHAPVAVA